MSLHGGVQGACTTPPVAHHSTGTSSSTGDSISSRCSDYKQLGRLPDIAAPRFPACTAWRFESSQAISEIQLSQEVTCEEVEQILAKKKPFTAEGRDKLPNGFLRALGPRFCQALAILTSTCWKLEYFPERFKSAKTVCLRKPGKGTYNQAKAWRPIALLNTTGKLMEAIAAARLSKIAEEAGLLPDIQMGFRKGRSTEAALFLLTSQVEKVWKEGMVASLLSLDISEAYDRVLPKILQQILKRKGILLRPRPERLSRPKRVYRGTRNNVHPTRWTRWTMCNQLVQLVHGGRGG